MGLTCDKSVSAPYSRLSCRRITYHKLPMRPFACAQFVAIAAALLGSIGCGAKTPTQPQPPAYELKTHTFSGSVKAAGTTGFPFTVVNPGEIQVAMTQLAPLSTITMGIGVGVWDAATSICIQQLSTDVATLNVAYAATPPAPGEYCVAIFDTGNVQVTSDFTLTVTHY